MSEDVIIERHFELLFLQMLNMEFVYLSDVIRFGGRVFAKQEGSSEASTL